MVDTDTVQIELTPQEKAIQTGKKEVASERVKEPQTVKEGSVEAKPETVKAETTDKEVKETKEADVVADIFGIGKKLKKSEPVSEEPLAENERAEYQKLKSQVQEQTEIDAFNKTLDGYSKEAIDVLKPTIDKLIEKDPEGSKFYDLLLATEGITPEQRALAIVALAEKRHRVELIKLGQKSTQAQIDSSLQEAAAKTEVKAIGNAKVGSNQPPESLKEKFNRDLKAYEHGDPAAKTRVLVSDAEIEAVKRFKR